jgi:hypothetical protein
MRCVPPSGWLTVPPDIAICDLCRITARIVYAEVLPGPALW